MNGSKLLNRLYAVIVVNLLLWMIVFGLGYQGYDTRIWAAGGFIFSALAQHWAYYTLRKAQRNGLLQA